MKASLFERVRQLVARGTPTLDALDDLREELLDALLPDGTALSQAQLSNGAEEQLLIDVLTSMYLVDRHDPAHAWSLATALYAMRRYYEAALAFLEAGERFRDSATTTPLTNDEEEWETSCLEHAADCFAKGELGLSAVALRLDAGHQ